MGALLTLSFWIRRRKWYHLLLSLGWAFYAVATFTRLPIYSWPSPLHVLGMMGAVVGLGYILAGAVQYFVSWDFRRTVIWLGASTAVVATLFVSLAMIADTERVAGALTLALQAAVLLTAIGVGARRWRRLAETTPNAFFWFVAVAVFGLLGTFAYLPLVDAGLEAVALGFTVLTSVSGVFLMAMFESDHSLGRLRESEARFAALFESNVLGLIHTCVDGRVLDANDEYLRIIGRSRADLDAGIIDWTKITPPEFLDMEQAAIEHAQVLGVSVPYEKQYIRPDGERVWVLLGFVLLGPDKECAVAFVLDRTEQKRVEAELASYRLGLEALVEQRTSQLEGAVASLQDANWELSKAQGIKDRLLASVSHELRTPLNSIIGFSGIMLQGLAGELSEEQRTQLEMVNSSGKHLLELVNDILDYERFEAGRVEPSYSEFDVCELVTSVAERMRPACSAKKLELVTDLPRHCGVIESDKRLVEQIVWNLLGNATKFTDEGSISVAVRETPGVSVAIEVADTGIGMDEARLARVFEEFVGFGEADDGRGKGTGLGLALSLSMARLLGGGIEAKSEVGKGSCFAVTLPLRRKGI